MFITEQRYRERINTANESRTTIATPPPLQNAERRTQNQNAERRTRRTQNAVICSSHVRSIQDVQYIPDFMQATVIASWLHWCRSEADTFFTVSSDVSSV